MPRPRTEAVPHDCLACGQPVVPRAGECTPSFNARRFCSRNCWTWSLRDRRRFTLGNQASQTGRSHLSSETVVFPGARAATLAEAPKTCACGAAWRAEDGALACRMCGRRLYVESELRRVVERYGFVTSSAG